MISMISFECVVLFTMSRLFRSPTLFGDQTGKCHNGRDVLELHGVMKKFGC